MFFFLYRYLWRVNIQSFWTNCMYIYQEHFQVEFSPLVVSFFGEISSSKSRRVLIKKSRNPWVYLKFYRIIKLFIEVNFGENLLVEL